jgi:uncharacterized protein YwbE
MTVIADIGGFMDAEQAQMWEEMALLCDQRAEEALKKYERCKQEAIDCRVKSHKHANVIKVQMWEERALLYDQKAEDALREYERYKAEAADCRVKSRKHAHAIKVQLRVVS